MRRRSVPVLSPSTPRTWSARTRPGHLDFLKGSGLTRTVSQNSKSEAVTIFLWFRVRVHVWLLWQRGSIQVEGFGGLFLRDGKLIQEARGLCKQVPPVCEGQGL